MKHEIIEPDLVLRDFVERIEQIGIDYMLTGSMAMMKYAMPRYTMDIDIVIDLKAENSNRIIETLEPDYYVPHQAVHLAVSRKGMFNVIHQNSSFKIDCVIKKETEFQSHAFANRRLIDYADFNVWIIAQDDLIISKLWWAKDSKSEMQLRDVKNLMRAGYNSEYVRAWAEKLNLSDLLRRCRKEIEE